MKTPIDNEDVLEQLARVKQRAASQTRLCSLLIPLLETIMADQAALNQEIDKLEQKIKDDQAGDQAVVDALNATIADLQAKIDELELGTDFQPFIDRLQALGTQIVPVTGSTPA